MRISDWSSDVCSSDLDQRAVEVTPLLDVGAVAPSALDDRRIGVRAAGKLAEARGVVGITNAVILADLLYVRLAAEAQLIDMGVAATTGLGDRRFILVADLIDRSAQEVAALLDIRAVEVALLVDVRD